MKHPIYLIDDVKFGIAGISTSWDYDNRATSNVKDVFPTSLTDPALGIPVCFKRDFQNPLLSLPSMLRFQHMP